MKMKKMVIMIIIFFQLEQTIAQFNKIKIKEEDKYVYSVSY